MNNLIEIQESCDFRITRTLFDSIRFDLREIFVSVFGFFFTFLGRELSS